MTKFATTILIERLDGMIYDLGALGIRVRSFDPPSPNYQHTYQQTGSMRSTRTDTKVQQLSIPLTFDVYATDNYDYELQRLKVLEIFRSHEEFYVINSRTPYLRWRVVAEAFSYPRLNNFWKASNVSVTLTCADGFAESVETSLKIHDKEALWGLGMNFPFDEEINYSFTNQNKIRFFNASNIPLLCEEHPVKILFSGSVSSKLTIHNKTTNQTWVLNKSLNSKDQLIIEGLVPVLNQTVVFDACNHAYLDFSIGWNELEISGATNFKISFDTRFYY